MIQIFRNILAYLKDWKNLLSHTIIGILILILALYLPIKPIYRIIALIIIIFLNITRMKFSKNNKMKNENNPETI